MEPSAPRPGDRQSHPAGPGTSGKDQAYIDKLLTANAMLEKQVMRLQMEQQAKIFEAIKCHNDSFEQVVKSRDIALARLRIVENLHHMFGKQAPHLEHEKLLAELQEARESLDAMHKKLGDMTIARDNVFIQLDQMTEFRNDLSDRNQQQKALIDAKDKSLAEMTEARDKAVEESKSFKAKLEKTVKCLRDMIAQRDNAMHGLHYAMDQQEKTKELLKNHKETHRKALAELLPIRATLVEALKVAKHRGQPTEELAIGNPNGPVDRSTRDDLDKAAAALNQEKERHGKTQAELKQTNSLLDDVRTDLEALRINPDECSRAMNDLVNPERAETQRLKATESDGDGAARLDTLEREAKVKKMEYDRLHKELEISRAALLTAQEGLRISQTERQALAHQLQFAKATRELLGGKLNLAEKALDSSEEDCQSLRGDIEIIKDELETALRKALDERDGLQSKLKASKKTCDSRVRDLEDSMEQLANEARSLAAEVTKLRKECQDSESRLLETKEFLRAARRAGDRKQREVQDALERLGLALAKRDRAIEELKAATDARDQAETALEDARNQCKKHKETCEDQKESLGEISHELDYCRNSLDKASARALTAEWTLLEQMLWSPDPVEKASNVDMIPWPLYGWDLYHMEVTFDDVVHFLNSVADADVTLFLHDRSCRHAYLDMLQPDTLGLIFTPEVLRDWAGELDVVRAAVADWTARMDKEDAERDAKDAEEDSDEEYCEVSDWKDGQGQSGNSETDDSELDNTWSGSDDDDADWPHNEDPAREVHSANVPE